MNAYTLVFASLLLTAGALGDRFGAKRIFIGGFAMFTVASLVCGLAGSITVLIAGRIAQGVGAALCVPASLALVSASFPDAAARARAVSIWAGVGVFGSLVAGPGRLLGGMHWAMLLAGVALVIGCLVSILGMGPRPFSLRQFSLRQTASGRKAS
jgi:MFS family permease